MHNPKLSIAIRNETDCWHVLVKHTNGCAACLDLRIRRDENGLGCDVGHACKDEWLIASRRRLELSDSYSVSREDPRTATSDRLSPS